MDKKQCKYCKQYIDIDEHICPYCSSKLEPSKNKNITIIIGIVLTILWAIGNIVLLYALQSYPSIIQAKDKDGIYEYMFSDFLNLILMPIAYVIIPYIISLVKKQHKTVCIIGMIIISILACCFVGYCTHLFSLYR